MEERRGDRSRRSGRGVSSGAIAVNDFGLIDGVSENGLIDPLTGFPEVIAVAWRNGNIISLGTLGGNQSASAGRLSNRGEIVGGAMNDVPDPLANDFSRSSFMFGPRGHSMSCVPVAETQTCTISALLEVPTVLPGSLTICGHVSVGNSYTQLHCQPHYPGFQPSTRFSGRTGK